MKKPALTSNSVIDRLVGRKRRVLKTITRKGAVYHFDDDLKIIPADIIDRLVGKNILIPGNDGLLPGESQSFTLSPSWGGAS